MDDLIAVASIIRPRALKGEVIAIVLTDFPERFEGLQHVTAVLPDASRLELKIENFWFQNGRVVLKFEGYDSLDAAEGLRGSEVCVYESETVKLEEDEFFDWQLVGCTVERIEGKSIG